MILNKKWEWPAGSRFKKKLLWL